MTLATTLFDALWARGVRHIFGLPGDYALNLFDALQDDGRFGVVRLGHEPSVGFAADGYARGTGGLGVAAVTYGAGGLNMVNPVACAYAEESPLVVLSGGPGLAERRTGLHVHHEVKTYESQLTVYREVTDYAAILDDPRTAATHIVRALDCAATRKRPVYLEVPRDMVRATIDPPTAETHPGSTLETGAVAEAVDEMVARLQAAANPVLIVGVEVHRFQQRDALVRLAEALGVPVVSSFLGRGAFPSRHPLFAGTYLGVVSPDPLRRVVEDADLVVLLGERISDTTLGVPAARLDESRLVLCAGREVFIRHHQFHHAPLEQVVAGLLAAPGLPRRAGMGPKLMASGPTGPEAASPSGMNRVIAALNGFFDKHPRVPLVADTGDSLFAAVDVRSDECMAPAYYATMGFAVPAALGLQVGTGRRPVVLVGDGAFQMTGPELSRAAAYGCAPVVVLLNNSRWEMLQAFVPGARYNETPGWNYAQVAGGWGLRYAQAAPDALAGALEEAWSRPECTLIEVPLVPGDISPGLARFVAAFKARLRNPSAGGA